MLVCDRDGDIVGVKKVRGSFGDDVGSEYIELVADLCFGCRKQLSKLFKDFILEKKGG